MKTTLQSDRKTRRASRSWRRGFAHRRKEFVNNSPNSALQTILGNKLPAPEVEVSPGAGSMQTGMTPTPNLTAKELVDPLVFGQHSPIQPDPNSPTSLWKIMEEVRGLSPERQILLRDRLNWWLRQTQPNAAPTANDNTMREAIRRAKGSMAGLMPTTAEFLAEKHAKLEQEERNLGAPFDRRSEGGE